MTPRRARGLTLIELMISIALMTVLIGVASFVFMSSQKIWSRVDRRLQTAQAWRSTCWLLESDLGRFQRVNASGDPVVCMKLTTAAAPTYDTLTFVSHGPREEATGIKEAYYEVTYAIDATKKGLWRTKKWLEMNAATAKLEYAVAPSLWADPQVSEVFPAANVFRVEWCGRAGGTDLQTAFQPANAGTGSGATFYGGSRPPAALQVRVSVEEEPGKGEPARLTFMKVFACP